MLYVLPTFLRIPLAISTIAVNTAVHFVPIFGIGVVKLVVPIRGVRAWLSRVMSWCAENWVAVNNIGFDLLTKIDWQVEGRDGLRHDGHYLVLSNHQSWVDIPVLQRALGKRIPFLKFFLKKQLIWVPLLGLAWWALDFPFMHRHSSAFLKKHPEQRGKDMETTRKACEKFRDMPVAVMNFAEGTRFTDAKKARQRSPFTHLLQPRAGGTAFVLGAMGDILSSVVDVTIIYPDGRPTFLDMVAGRIRVIRVLVRELPIPGEVVGGDYETDPAYRERVQRWITQLWLAKDAQIAEVLGETANRRDHVDRSEAGQRPKAG